MTTIKKTNTTPATLSDVQNTATAAAADGKLTKAEKKSITDGFKSLDRDGQLQALDFLKKQSGPLAAFASESTTLRNASSKRVGGDQKLDGFLANVDAASGPGKNGSKQGPEGFSTTETSSLAGDFRALSKADQKSALEALRAGGKEKLATALESSVAPAAPQRGTASLGEFQQTLSTAEAAGGAGLDGLKARDRSKLLQLFRGLSQDDRQAALDQVKGAHPALAQAFDNILNPRPLPVVNSPVYFGANNANAANANNG